MTHAERFCQPQPPVTDMNVQALTLRDLAWVSDLLSENLQMDFMRSPSPAVSLVSQTWCRWIQVSTAGSSLRGDQRCWLDQRPHCYCTSRGYCRRRSGHASVNSASHCRFQRFCLRYAQMPQPTTTS